MLLVLDRNARRVQSLQVLIRIIRSYSAEILRIYRGASRFGIRWIHPGRIEFSARFASKIVSRRARELANPPDQDATTDNPRAFCSCDCQEMLTDPNSSQERRECQEKSAS